MHVPWKSEDYSRNKIAIDAVYDELDKCVPGTSTYQNITNNLKTLYEIQENKKGNSLDVNTVVTVAGYVVVAGAVLIFEAFGHTLTTKVTSLAIPKPRI